MVKSERPNSVLYLSLGSQSSISASQMKELAKGLEASKKSFIWVIRPPIMHDINSEFREEWLPEGFEKRMRERNQGILVKKWAPQSEILSHGSTGAFFSHCGWNSVLESLSQGVPLIGWPIFGEQFYNSKLLEDELGVCMNFVRENWVDVRCDEIAKVIEMVMGKSEKGEEMRRRAGRVKEMMENAHREDESLKGCSVKAMKDFISEALTRKKKISY